MPEPSESHDPYRALRYGEYRWFLGATTASFMASQLQSLVLGWQVYEITRDPLSLGLIGLSEVLPFLALGLVGGWAADRRDRRAISLAATATLLVGAGALLALNLGPSPRTVWPFYAVQALAGLARAFHGPASQALGTELVPRAAYENAATWRSSGAHLAMVAGPALGGLVYGVGNARVAYGVEAALLAFAWLALSRVTRRPRAPAASESLGASLTEGIRFVFKKRLLLSALSLDMFAVLFGGAVALLPAFAYDILHVGPLGLGVLRAAPALGAVGMSLHLAHRPPLQRAGAALLGCVAAFGVCWMAFAFSQSFVLSFSILAASGAFDTVSVVLRATLVQTQTPAAMMGRVQAVNSFFIGSSNELGAFESGLAARLLGIVPSVVLGACVTILVVAVTAVRTPELRKMTRLLA
jgi:MFS family permease